MTTAEELYEKTWNSYHRECQRKALSCEPVSCNTGSMFLPVTPDETASVTPAMESDILSGVSLTFPDGTIVNIKRGAYCFLFRFGEFQIV